MTQWYLVQNNKFNEWKVQLCLYIVDSGLWRCGGKLNNSSLSENAKHPILLPTEHYFTSLIALDCHKHVMHGGVSDTLTKIRMWFWILRGRSFLRKLLRHCTVCTRFNARPFKAPEAPPLPVSCPGISSILMCGSRLCRSTVCLQTRQQGLDIAVYMLWNPCNPLGISS